MNNNDIAPRNPTVHEERRETVIHNRRLPSREIFGGWGPKLLAVAVMAATAASASPARASANAPVYPNACAEPARAASMVRQSYGEYPQFPLEARIGGTAILRVDLDANGGVVQTTLLRSSGNPMLDREAARESREARYAPAQAACADIATSLLYEVAFDPS